MGNGEEDSRSWVQAFKRLDVIFGVVILEGDGSEDCR